MPTTKIKPVYLGKCLGDLGKLFEVNLSKPKLKKVKMLYSSAEKVHDKAVLDELSGDEEMAYVGYMKYLELIGIIQKTDEYKKDVAYFKDLIGYSKITTALSKAEKLSSSLQARYKLLSEEASVDAALQEQERIDAEEEERKRREKENRGPAHAVANGGGIADLSDMSLSSTRLFTLLQGKTLRILLLDARPETSYTESHMTFHNCINIPQEIIKAGISAAALGNLLPNESRAAFAERMAADLVVMFDWTTTEKMLSPGSNLYTLRNILQKWDPGVFYKNRPLILEGGFDDWLHKYPQYTTNPHAKPPPPYDPFDDFLLDDISYPDLNESLPDRSVKPRVATPPDALIMPSSSLTVRPNVNRASKAAAIQTYDERMNSVSELLYASEKVADTSLEIEKTRLKTEKEWELVRLRKEKEVEEDMRVQLQEREEELLLSLTLLEESQRKSLDENKALRSQLDEYRKRETEETSRLFDEQRRQRESEAGLRIQQKEEEMKTIALEREEIAKERLRKVDEDRKKRKQEEEKKLELERAKGENANGPGMYFTPLQTDAPSNSTPMQHSHSSSNVAQILDDPDPRVVQRMPQFDRAIKPLQKPQKYELNAARQRHFNGVLGTSGKGITGLKNLGNTCYMNSIMQCINNTEPLAEYFCAGTYRKDVNDKSETRGDIVLEVAAVVRALWSGQFKQIACVELKDVVGQYKDEFRGTQQQDSHEFLFFLINFLHDDLNRSASNKNVITNTMDCTSNVDKQWHEFQRCNKSIIVTLFYGQQKSSVCCNVCHKESSTYETFNHLSLPVPNTSGRCTISECMKLYLSGEHISGWKCPDCNQLRDATKKFDLIKLPRILVIHFKRFYHDGWSSKKQTFIEFPLERLDMETFTPVPQQRYTKYELYGVSNHYGTMEGGHYTAYCKNAVYNSWVKFDDSDATEMSPGDVKSGAAYILFYTALDNKVRFNR